MEVEVKTGLNDEADIKLQPDEITKKFFLDINKRVEIEECLYEKVALYARYAIHPKIKEHLEQEGFTFINWRYLTPLGQARVAKTAKILITTEEAEIGNVVFTNPQTKIIQLVTDEKRNPAKALTTQLKRCYNKQWKCYAITNCEENLEEIKKIIATDSI